MGNTALPWIGFETLLAALTRRAGASPEVECIWARPWASMSVAGARFCFALWFEGPLSQDHIQALTHGLENTEFDLGEHILADIITTTQAISSAGGTIEFEALILAND